MVGEAFLPIRFEDHHEGGLKKARKLPVKETRQVAGVEQCESLNSLFTESLQYVCRGYVYSDEEPDAFDQE
jgi:hypothetical protein